MPSTSAPSLAAILVLIIGSAISYGPAAAAGDGPTKAGDLARLAHVPDEILVQYQPSSPAGARAAARARVGAKRLETVAEATTGHGQLERVRIPPGQDLAGALEAVAADPAVAFAEPNWVYSHEAVSDDPAYGNGSLWGMYGDATTPANAFGSQAGEAWATSSPDCSTVWVGIIDEGYMVGHEDLAANAGTNPGEVAGNGIDDDGNGYRDDVYGWDFDGGNNSVFDGLDDAHGTHVAGTIGAVGGNARGVAGVCWSVKLMSAKFLGRRGGTTANAIKAVDYVTDLKTRQGLNVVATNNSWGGGGYSQGLFDAIARADAAGILFVAAAGNGGGDGVGDNNDSSASYPSNYSNPNVIAVAAITSSGAKAGYSNYGALTVDLGAPGSGIVSTVPVKSGSGRNATIVSGYASYSGTSMATPHVTGAAALYAARHPGATAAQIKAAILDSTLPTAGLAGKCVTGGRLDLSGF